jgi:hypothetical protein
MTTNRNIPEIRRGSVWEKIIVPSKSTVNPHAFTRPSQPFPVQVLAHVAKVGAEQIRHAATRVQSRGSSLASMWPDITGDREETCAEGHDQLVDASPLRGPDEFAAAPRFDGLFSGFLLADAPVLVFSVEIEFFSPYNFGHEPGIHLDAGFNCLLITARSEIAALIGYFYCFAA